MPPCTGVDLNRNFGYRWGAFSLDPRVGSRLTCLETYMGTRPFSEPETTAIRRFIMGQPSGTFEVLIIFESPLDILLIYRVNILSISLNIFDIQDEYDHFRCTSDSIAMARR